VCLCVSVVSLDPIDGQVPVTSGTLPPVLFLPVLAWLPHAEDDSGVRFKALELAGRRAGLHTTATTSSGVTNTLGSDELSFPEGPFAAALSPFLLEPESRLRFMRRDNDDFVKRKPRAAADNVDNLLYSVEFEDKDPPSMALWQQVRETVLAASGPGYCRVKVTRVDTELARSARNRKAPSVEGLFNPGLPSVETLPDTPQGDIPYNEMVIAGPQDAPQRVVVSPLRQFMKPQDVISQDSALHDNILALQRFVRAALFWSTNLNFRPEDDGACPAASHYSVLLDRPVPLTDALTKTHAASLASLLQHPDECARVPAAGGRREPASGGKATAPVPARHGGVSTASKKTRGAVSPADVSNHGTLRRSKRKEQGEDGDKDRGQTHGESCPASKRRPVSRPGVVRTGWPSDICLNDEVLHLVVETDPFVVMVLGEKRDEYRQCTSYWRDRLFTPDNEWRGFKYLHIGLGMRPNRPQFLAECLGVRTVQPLGDISFSTGYVLTLDHAEGYFALRLGQTLWCSGNLNLGVLLWSAERRRARRGRAGLPGFSPAPC